MAAGFQFGKGFRVLRHRDFGIFVAGNCASLIGTWAQRVATGWLTWEFTQSAAWLGVMAFADLIPAVVIGPFAGVAADRWDRLAIMKLAQALGSVLSCALAVLYFLGLVDIFVLLGFTLALGIVDAFVQPFRLAFVSALVPRAELTAAVAIRSTTFNLARFLGPAVAGIVIATTGVGWAFVFNAASFLIMLGSLAMLQVEPVVRTRVGIKTSVLADAIEGARFAFTSPGVGAVLILLAASCLTTRPVIELLPGWAGEIFSGSASDLAVLTSSIGFGALFGGVWLAGRPSPVGLVRIFLLSCGAAAVSVLVFSASHTLLFAVPLLAISGFFLVTSAISAQTLVQINVEDNLRGRVLSVYATIFRGGPAIGAVIIGLASDLFGLRWPLIVGAALLLVATAVIYRRRAVITPLLESHLP